MDPGQCRCTQAVAYKLTSRRRFTCIEQLEELPRELGWPLEYRQLEPGKFSSSLTNLEGDGCFVIEERSNRSIEVAAGAMSGVFVLALVEGDCAVVNGQCMSPDCVFLQSPGSDFRAVLPPGLRVTQVGVPAEELEAIIEAVAPGLPIPRGTVGVFPTTAGSLASVRRAVRRLLRTPPNRETQLNEAVTAIVADAMNVVNDRSAASASHYLHGVSARLARDRAFEFIEVHLTQKIRVTAICQHAGTALRTLERIFARELGMPPQQYVKVRRLNAVRRCFLAADVDTTPRVDRVARRFGFTHLGRCAGDYRCQFGESPRETLSRR